MTPQIEQKIITVVFFLITIPIMCWISFTLGERLTRLEAIKHGVAEYVVDSQTGIVSFQYKIKDNE